jgi:phosphoribosyl 1,2-cyclic phosphate phosphodiesterase
MKTKLKITFLGTGSALGVPQLGCHCHVCTSTKKVNKRKRTCFLLETSGKTFIVDPGPDTKILLEEHPIKKLDGVIITHAHHDHIGGYDDLRIYAIRQEGVIPTLIHEKNTEELKKRCGYLFKPGFTYFHLETLSDDWGHGVFEGVSYKYFTYFQNGMSVTGFIFDDVAFCSDIQVLDDRLAENLRGLDTIIVSCVLKPTGPYKSHLNLQEIQDLKVRAGVNQVIITHMGHDIDYDKLSKELEEDFLLSFDGFTYQA